MIFMYNLEVFLTVNFWFIEYFKSLSRSDKNRDLTVSSRFTQPILWRHIYDVLKKFDESI